MPRTWSGQHIGPPYLLAAVICQEVFQDRPGLVDVHGIHADELLVSDRERGQLRLAREGQDLFLWLSFASDGALGEYAVSVEFRSPTEELLDRISHECEFDEIGYSAAIPVGELSTGATGIHHFDVGLEGRFVTRVPYILSRSLVGRG